MKTIGVDFVVKTGQWMAYTFRDSKKMIIGYYDTKNDAVEALLEYIRNA
jgi:hypothetical protein